MSAALDTTTWYAVRATGLTAEMAMLSTVLVGLLKTTRVLAGRPRPAWLVDLHRALAALTLVWVGLHVATLLLDRFVPSGWADIAVPLHQRWHPLAVAYGVVAMWMLVVVQGSSWLQKRIPPRLWRRLHLLSAPMGGLVIAHGLSAGTDRRSWPVLMTTVAGATLLMFLAALRLLLDRRAVGPVARTA